MRSLQLASVSLAAVALVAVSLLSSATPARADTIYTAFLNGPEQGTTSPATGYATVLLNDAQNMALVSVHFNGLLAPQNDAHVHGPAPVGVNAPPVFQLPLGTFSHLAWAISPTDVARLQAGLLYINVHSTLYPAGEIRGQLNLSVPGQPAVGGEAGLLNGDTPASAATGSGPSGSTAFLGAAGAAAAAVVGGGFLLRGRISRAVARRR
jgi:hypothetical protein